MFCFFCSHIHVLISCSLPKVPLLLYLFTSVWVVVLRRMILTAQHAFLSIWLLRRDWGWINVLAAHRSPTIFYVVLGIFVSYTQNTSNRKNGALQKEIAALGGKFFSYVTRDCTVFNATVGGRSDASFCVSFFKS